jgi:BCD family chlorophyll transporter-like MFS transporter
LIGTPSLAYAMVFAFEALLFVAAAVLAARLGGTATTRSVPEASTAMRGMEAA